jgi:vancomycin resistance protein YoaR
MGMQEAHPQNIPARPSRQVDERRTGRMSRGSKTRVPDVEQLPLLSSSFFQLSIVGIAGAFLIVTLVVAALGRDSSPEGTVPSGVMVAGTDISELSNEEARLKLQQRMSTYAEQPFVITWNEKNWEPTMAELGAEFNFDQTVERATHSYSTIQRAQHRVFGVEERDVPLRLSLHEETLHRYAASIAEEVDTSPRVPELGIDDGRVTISDAQTGIEINQEKLASDITDALFNLRSDPIAVEHDEIVPEVTDEDVASVRSLIDEALSEPITLWFEDQSWSIEPERLAEFMTLQPGENGGMELAFHHDPIVEYLAGLVGDINRAPRNAQIAWGGSSVVATSPSQNGIERDLYGTVERLEEAIANRERSVELAHHVVRPAIDSNNLGELGIDGLMSQGQSAFWNSAPSRANNISVAASYLDGTVIPPGHEFSFNNAVGEISLERGYEEGYVIEAEATVEGVGGGVCQVSTTVFRAAYFSGLPITERHPHAYIVGFYEQGNWPLGFDAAIFQPDLDFRFVNSTDSYMLLHTHVADGQIYVNLYGPDLGYSVQMGEPVIQNEQSPPGDVEIVDDSLAPGQRRQVEEARPGMEVTLPRTVINRDGEVVREDYFYSNFQAWGNRFLVGPSTSPNAQSPDEAPSAGDPSGEIIEEQSTDSEG